MKLRTIVPALLVAASFATSAHAGFIDTVTATTGGTLNTYHDASFEHIDYQNASKGLQVGDVIVGFNQINLKESPNSLSTFNTIYTVFSEQVASISSNGEVISFAPTTSSNAESLKNILSGVPGVTVAANTLAMVFDRPQSSPYADNLINNPPASATSINDYLTYIAKNGTNEFSAGIVGTNDYLQTTLGKLAGQQLVANTTYTGTPATASNISTATSTGTIATFLGGLSITQNNTGLVFGTLQDQNTGNYYQLVINNGIIKGGSNDSNYSTWGSQGGNAGVEDSADFNVNMISPEPSSLVLFGVGIASVFAAGCFRRKKLALAA